MDQMAHMDWAGFINVWELRFAPPTNPQALPAMTKLPLLSF
jgi:hypothetical protein